MLYAFPRWPQTRPLAYDVSMPIITVSDIHDPQLRMYSHQRDALLLSWPGYEHGLFVGESYNVIDRAMDSGLTPLSFLLEEKWLDKTMPLIEKAWERDPQIPAFVATHERYQAITSFEVTRGGLAAFARPALPGLESLLHDAHRIAILEDITNYSNVGAIFRSAAALGIDAVLVTPGCHDPYYRRAARVSMGTVFQVPWTRIGTTSSWAKEGIGQLHELGFEVAALALTPGAIPLDEPRLASCKRLALVLGTEGEGLSHETIEACDHTVIIPMDHGVDSLNVAVASGIAFWELRYRRA